MAPSSRSNRPDHSTTSRAAVLWVGAGGLGMTTAVVLASRRFATEPVPPEEVIVIIAIGWLIMLAFAPWRTMLAMAKLSAEVGRLSVRLRRCIGRQRAAPVRELILDRDDDLGDLSRLVYETLRQALAHRNRSEHLTRTMHERIREETDRATSRLQREATTDPLTGLGNRRYLEQRLEELFGPERRRQTDVVVAMLLDVDHFKPVNDTLGHDVGDQCLVCLGEILRNSVRIEDAPFRLGGDEFGVIMPNQTIEEANAVARRISTLFKQMPWPHDGLSRPTLSIGLGLARGSEPDGAESLLRRADEALYVSKRNGRDRISIDEERRVA